MCVCVSLSLSLYIYIYIYMCVCVYRSSVTQAPQPHLLSMVGRVVSPRIKKKQYLSDGGRNSGVNGQLARGRWCLLSHCSGNPSRRRKLNIKPAYLVWTNPVILSATAKLIHSRKLDCVQCKRNSP